MNYITWLRETLGENYEITEILQYKENNEEIIKEDGKIKPSSKINLIVKYLAGTSFKQSVVIPIQFSWRTWKPVEQMQLFTKFSQKHSNTTLVDDEFNYIIQNYGTPLVANNFENIGNTKQSQIIMSGVLIISQNVDDIQKIEIDGETIETTTRTLTYSTEIDNQRTGNININNSNVSRANLQLTFTGISKNLAFYNKVEQIMFGELDINTDFKIVIYYLQNNRTREIKMKLNSNSINSQDRTLPLQNIALIK